MSYIGYEKKLQEQLQDLNNTDKPIVLFGTLEMSMYAKKSLDFLSKKITCFCDNNSDKWGENKDGIVIVSPEQVKLKYSNAKIYICSFNRDNIIQIKNQLLNMGFEDVYNSDMLFYVYQIYVMKRPILSSDLANTMEILNNPKDKLIVGEVPGNLPVVITEKCNLRCRDCGVMMPYYKHPKHYSKDFIVKSIQSLAECVDAIETLNIIGGETFLHPDLADICEEVAKIGNIHKLMLVTNGTIVPNETVLQKIKTTIPEVIISDYGKLSTRKQELKKSLEKNEIFYTVFEDDFEWIEMLPPQKYSRSKNENEVIFSECKWAYFAPKIINGEFHLCDFSAAVAPFKLIPDNEEDYLKLDDNSLSIKQKRGKVSKLIKHTTCLQACDYCSFYKMISVPRAIQVKETLEF